MIRADCEGAEVTSEVRGPPIANRRKNESGGRRSHKGGQDPSIRAGTIQENPKMSLNLCSTARMGPSKVNRNFNRSPRQRRRQSAQRVWCADPLQIVRSAQSKCPSDFGPAGSTRLEHEYRRAELVEANLVANHFSLPAMMPQKGEGRPAHAGIPLSVRNLVAEQKLSQIRCPAVQT